MENILPSAYVILNTADTLYSGNISNEIYYTNYTHFNNLTGDKFNRPVRVKLIS